MRSLHAGAGGSARVLAAAALVTLTAACGPADMDIVATDAGAGAPTASTAVAAPADEEVRADAPVEQVAVPPATTPAAPVEASGDSVDPDVPEPSAAIPVEAQPEAQAEAQAETPAEPGGPVAEAPEPAAAPVPVPHAARRTPSTSSVPPPVAAAAAPVSQASTNGSGGSYTDQPSRTFTAANGRSGRYLRYAGGIDPARPVGLVVYADGTGEYGIDNPTSPYALGGSAGLVAVARSRNIITLAVESPDQGCECWHTGDTNGNADFLADLVETQLRSYPVSEVWLVGFSSGAQEITRFLVPRHPELMRVGGGWVLFGGGGPPAAGGAAVTAERMAGVRAHWYTGTADTAVPLTASWGAEPGERWYGARGVRTSHDWASGVGHGLDGRLGRTVAQLLDES